MDKDTAARALAALDQIRGFLQAAQFAAYRFEQLRPREPLDNLSEHIDRVKMAADGMRASIQCAVRRAAVVQAEDPRR